MSFSELKYFVTPKIFFVKKYDCSLFYSEPTTISNSSTSDAVNPMKANLKGIGIRAIYVVGYLFCLATLKSRIFWCTDWWCMFPTVCPNTHHLNHWLAHHWEALLAWLYVYKRQRKLYSVAFLFIVAFW